MGKPVQKEKGFKRKELIPTCSSILEEIVVDDSEVIPDRQTRSDKASVSLREFNLYHGYILKGNPEQALKECSKEFIGILASLESALTTRLGPLTQEPKRWLSF